MQGSTRPSTKARLRAFFLRLRQLVVRGRPVRLHTRFSPNSRTLTPQVGTRCDNPKIVGPVSEARSSPMEPHDESATSAGAGAFLGAHNFVINNIQRDTSTVAQGEIRSINGYFLQLIDYFSQG